MTKYNPHKKNLIILLLFFLVFAILLFIKLKFYNGFVPDWDEAEHLNVSLSYINTFHSHSLLKVISYFRYSQTIYPPLYHIITAINFYITRSWPAAGILTNTYFLLMLMVSIYYLGSKVDKPRTGLLAAVLTPVLPIFLTSQERSTIDLASSALFIFSFYLLFKTKYFTDLKYSVLLGVTLFFSLLAKWPFAIPSIPFVFYALYGLYNNWSKKKVILVNLTITLAISLLGTIWYLSHYNLMLGVLNFFWKPGGYVQILWHNPHGLSLDNVLYYLYSSPISGSGVGLIVLVIFYISFILPGKNKRELYLVSSVVITYLVLTYLDDKSPFYLIYSYPLLMIITISRLLNLKNIFYKNVLLSLFIISILINFALAQYNFISLNKVTINIKNGLLYILPNYDSRYAYGIWPTKEVADYIYKVGNCGSGLLVFSDHKFINTPNLNFYMHLLGANFLTRGAYQLYNPAKDTTFNLHVLQNYHCIVTKTGDPGIFANTDVMNFVTNYLSQDNRYTKNSFAAPDGSEIFVFLRKNVKS